MRIRASRLRLSLLATFFTSTFTLPGALAQGIEPCDAFRPPRLILNRENPIEPGQGVPLPALFTVERAANEARQPGYIGVCARREPEERDNYSIDGADWQKTNRSFDIACADIEGSIVKGSNYGTPWSAMSVRFPESQRGKLVSLVDWTVVYQYAGEDIKFGAWACQSLISANDIAVGFRPDLVLLNPLRLWGSVTSPVTTVTEAKVVADSDYLSAGRAVAVSADETAAGVVVYRLGKDFDKPLQLTVFSEAGLSGTLDRFDPTFLVHPAQGGSNSLSLAPADYVELTDSLGEKSKFAFAIYRAPRPTPALDNSGGATMTLMAINGDDTHKITLPVLGPPVVLVHGLWGDGATFSKWPYGKGAAPYNNWGYGRVIYEGHKSFRDPGNQRTLSDNISHQIQRMAATGIIGSRVDLVTHSMGGLMARQFLASDTTNLRYNTSPVYRLVTIDTPHTGSPLADVLYMRQGQPIANIECETLTVLTSGSYLECKVGQALGKTTVGSVIGAALGPIDSAVEDLRSATFDSSSMAPPTSASGGFMLVSSTASADDPIGLALTAVMLGIGEPGLDAIFARTGNGAGQHDLIVGTNSQRFFPGTVSKSFSNINHMDSTKDAGVQATVLCFLRNDPCNGNTLSKTTGTTRRKTEIPTAAWNLDLSGFQVSNASANIALDSALQRGFPASVSITVPGKVLRSAYLHSGTTWSSAQTLYAEGTPGFDWVKFSNVDVPHGDTLSVTILAVFTDNTFAAYSRSFPIGYAPLGNYGALKFVDDFISLPSSGATAQLQLVGTTPVAVPLPATEAQYSLSPDNEPIVSISSAGLVTALKSGSATITATIGDRSTTALLQVGEAAGVPAKPSVTIAGVSWEQDKPTIQIATTTNVSAEAVVTIGNQGTAALHLGAITWDSNWPALTFADNACTNATIAPGARCAFKVRFQPSAAGTVDTGLAVVTDDVAYPFIPVSVHAVATASNTGGGTGGTGGTGGGTGGGATQSGGGGGGGVTGPAELIMLLALLTRLTLVRRQRGPKRRTRW